MVHNTFRDLIFDPALGGGYQGRQAAQGIHPRRGVLAVVRTRDARRPARPGRGRRARLDARIRIHRRVIGEHDCAGARGMADHEVLPARVVRPVHALSRGRRLARADPAPRSRSGAAATRTWTCCSTCATTSRPASAGRRSRRRSARSVRPSRRPSVSAHLHVQGRVHRARRRRGGAPMPDETTRIVSRSPSTAATATAQPGEMLIAAAERAGTFIPRFCYHPRMAPVGVCRMCLVEVDGPRGPTLQPACYVTVTERMSVVTDSDKVKKAQDGVLEFLLGQPPARLPGLRQGRRVPAPGPDPRARLRRHPVRWRRSATSRSPSRCRSSCCSTASAASSAAAARASPPRSRARPRSTSRVAASRWRSPRSRPSRSPRTSRATPSRSARSARSPRRRTASRRAPGTSTRSSRPAPPARSGAASRSSPRRTASPACSASTPTRSTTAGSATRDGSPTRRPTAPRTTSRRSPLDSPRRRLTSPMLRRDGELVEVSWGEAIAAAADAIRARDRIVTGGVGAIGGAALTNEAQYLWARLPEGRRAHRQRRRAVRRRARPAAGRPRCRARRSTTPASAAVHPAARGRSRSTSSRSCSCGCAQAALAGSTKLVELAHGLRRRLPAVVPRIAAGPSRRRTGHRRGPPR